MKCNRTVCTLGMYVRFVADLVLHHVNSMLSTRILREKKLVVIIFLAEILRRNSRTSFRYDWCKNNLIPLHKTTMNRNNLRMDVPRVIDVPGGVHDQYRSSEHNRNRSTQLPSTSHESNDTSHEYNNNLNDSSFKEMFSMEDNDEGDPRDSPPPKLTNAPPRSPAVVKPLLRSQGSNQQVWQKRGRFLVWPAHLGEQFELISR